MEEIKEEEEPPGGTPFFKAAKLGDMLQINNLFFKFEGASATGTQKDRISLLHVLRAKELGYNTISLATCGNYGASISYFASKYGLRSVIATPQYYAGERNPEMLMNGSEVIQLPARYEDIVEYMRDMSVRENWYDASPGSSNSDLDVLGYEGIAFEIVNSLGHVPDYVAVPVGNGTTLAGIFSGFEKLYHTGRIDKLPGMIASSTSNGNPIVAAWKRRRKVIRDLSPETIRETPINEPLISYRSFDGQKALNAIYRSNGYAAYVGDEEMIRFSRYIEKYEDISVLPASSSALAAAAKVLKGEKRKSEIVVVLTGRNALWITR